ncbi:AbrB family transcriptional regulator [Cohnella cellulosilytica]|uniref:AbrB family transcriptional regulator n=1 Tax=Cohnella cellulosilytica TaxID=986710 RepID=A0ABW2FJG8_9BACL
MIGFLFTLLLALAGGALFSAVQMPVAWLLGPMVFVFVGTRFFRRVKPEWPKALRYFAMIVIGYSLGLSFTKPILAEMGRQLPTMLLMSVLLMLLCAVIAWMTSRLSGLPYRTTLMGSIPGGLSQMILLAQETRGIDMTVVVFLQVSRLMMIIFCVPLLVFSPLFGGVRHEIDAAADAVSATWGGLFPDIVLYAAACVGISLLAVKIKFPSPYLLGPMIITAALHLSGVPGPVLPNGLLDVAQVLIGTYVGLLLQPEKLEHKLKFAVLALLSGVLLLGGAAGLSFLLAELHPISHATAFLSMAPGGMDQMGFIGKEVHADIATVTLYQLFRTWFIFFAVIPIMRFSYRRLGESWRAREEAQREARPTSL